MTTTVSTAASKRIVLCLDGTWNSGFEEHRRRDGHTVLKPTNPLKLARAVLPFDGSGRMQITYYDIGVGALAEYPGTSNRLLRFSDRTLGGAWGAGFEGNVEDALHFLVLNFEPGDDVFVFGFSRGASEARAVTEFLDWNHGLPEKEDAYYLPRLFRRYVLARGVAAAQPEEVRAINDDRRKEKRPLEPLKAFRPVHVKYLGVWDTVMALGSRFESVGGSTSATGRSFYAGRVPARCVEHARQALAVDEQRYDFRPEIWASSLPGQTMEQRWFAGVHSNVGGSYGNDGLANIAFRWILDGATSHGLKIDEEFVKYYRPYFGDTLYDSYSGLYRFLDVLRARSGAGRRGLELPAEANADLDKGVIDRMLADPADLAPYDDGRPVTEPYRPENVIAFLARQADLDAYLKKLGVTNPLPDDVQQRIAQLRK